MTINQPSDGTPVIPPVVSATAQTTEQQQANAATEAKASEDLKAKELQDKLASQGRNTKELQEKLEAAEKKISDFETASLSEQEKIKKQLEDSQKKLLDESRQRQQLEIDAAVSRLVAEEEEAPELKKLLPFIKGTTVEEATENFNLMKKTIISLRESWQGEGDKGTTFPPKLSPKIGKPAQGDYEQAKERALKGDKKAISEMFKYSPRIN